MTVNHYQNILADLRLKFRKADKRLMQLEKLIFQAEDPQKRKRFEAEEFQLSTVTLPELRQRQFQARKQYYKLQNCL